MARDVMAIYDLIRPFRNNKRRAVSLSATHYCPHSTLHVDARYYFALCPPRAYRLRGVGQTVILHRFSSSPHQQGSPLCYHRNAFVSRCLRTYNRQIHNHRKAHTREVSVEQGSCDLAADNLAVQSHNDGYSIYAVPQARGLLDFHSFEFSLTWGLKALSIYPLYPKHFRVECFPCESASTTPLRIYLSLDYIPHSLYFTPASPHDHCSCICIFPIPPSFR